MAIVRVPPNCQSVTTSAQGLIAASGNLITVTSALEATSLTSPYSIGPGGIPIQSTNTNGTVNMLMPSVVTAININGSNYSVVAGAISNVPAADAANFIVGLRQRESMFELVTG